MALIIYRCLNSKNIVIAAVVGFVTAGLASKLSKLFVPKKPLPPQNKVPNNLNGRVLPNKGGETTANNNARRNFNSGIGGIIGAEVNAAGESFKEQNKCECDK